MELTKIIDNEIKKIKTERNISSDELFLLTKKYYSYIDNGYMEYDNLNKIKRNICYDRDLCFQLNIDYNTISSKDTKKLNLFVLRLISKTPINQLNKLEQYF